MQDHHQVEHLKIPLHCVLCNKDYSSKRTLLGHNKLYHLIANSGEVFTCSHCGKTFISQGLCLCLKKFHHVLNVKKRLQLHEGRHNKFTCEDCGTNYTTKVDFQAHVDIVHKGLPKLACVEWDVAIQEKLLLDDTKISFT